MKRLFLTVTAALCLAVAFAENEGANEASAYDMQVSQRSLARYLKLTPEQGEAVADIHSEFCIDMMNAREGEGGERDFLVKNAVAKDLRLMRAVLSKEQYDDYLKVLNATFRNRGLIK